MRIFFASALFFFFTSVFGQSSILDEYIKVGLKTNLALQQEQFDYEKSVRELKYVKGYFYPQVSLEGGYSALRSGKNSNVFISRIPETITLPVVMDIDIPAPIGPAVLPVNETLEFSRDSLIALPKNFEHFYESKIRIVQPLLNADILFGYKAQREMTSLQKVKYDAYKSELTKEIKTAYYQYIQTEEVLKVYSENEKLLKELLRVNRKLVENQKATKDVIYSTEFELSNLETQHVSAIKDNQLAKSWFNFLLNRTLETPIEIDTNLTIVDMDVFLNVMENDAVRKRPELKQLQHALQANEYSTKLYQYNKLPEISAVFDAGFQGFAKDFGSDQNFQQFYLTLKWDLFKGFQNKSKIEQSQIQTDLLEAKMEEAEKQIRLEVKQAYYEFTGARSGLEAARNGVRTGKRALNAIEKKYENNQASMLELMDARTKFKNAQITLSVNRFNYMVKLSELEWVIGKY